MNSNEFAGMAEEMMPGDSLPCEDMEIICRACNTMGLQFSSTHPQPIFTDTALLTYEAMGQAMRLCTRVMDITSVISAEINLEVWILAMKWRVLLLASIFAGLDRAWDWLTLRFKASLRYCTTGIEDGILDYSLI
jgi:hypothetical protein